MNEERALKVAKRIMTGTLRAMGLLGVIVCVIATQPSWAKSKNQNSDQLRKEYLNRVEEQVGSMQSVTTLGSLYNPSAAFLDMSSDYKAHQVGDIVTLVVLENTSAQSTGDVNTSRSYTTSSAITGLPGGASTSAVNPLFGANSSTQLKGTGETSDGSNLTTTLAARVIALLPNGFLVVEAERKYLINSQHETMILRGILRPGDVGPNNTASSTALANLEIEMKGKGVVTDAIHRPNPIIRGLEWLFSF
ncbi:MAG: flagellar basal body L-ring protein FlgH [Terriglobales bacterium]